MPKVYVGIGHGRTPSGKYDPGAVAGPDWVEHEWAHRVCDVYAAALQRCGFTVNLERHAGSGHDPNWVGSASAANAWRADLADEIHFNALNGSAHGVETLVSPHTGAKNRECAKLMVDAISRVTGLTNRGVKERGDLGWLSHTSMPSILIEVAFIDNAADQSIMRRADFVSKVAEALTQSRCQSSGVPYVPPGQPTPSPGPARAVDAVGGCMVPETQSGVWLVKPDGGVFAYRAPFYGSMGGARLASRMVGIAPTPAGKGYWLVGADGGVFTFGDAGYHGSYPALPPEARRGDRAFVAIQSNEKGGYTLVADDGSFYSFPI